MNTLTYLDKSLCELPKSWQNMLLHECQDDLLSIDKQLNIISQTNIIYPPRELIFNALRYNTINKIKVVILGQDPYHGIGEANGLAFSVNQGIKLPPSLLNIYKEISLEYETNLCNVNGELLIQWAKQGVLLLNSSLSVIENRPNSLSHIGGNTVTDKIITHISNNCDKIVFMLWGNFAQQKPQLINKNKHSILTSPHPSPLSAYRGFFGCKHFIKANQYLIDNKKPTINWFTER